MTQGRHSIKIGRKINPRTIEASRYINALVIFWLVLASHVQAARHTDSPLTPFRTTSKQGAYTIDTVGDTLGQASPQNMRLIIRVFGPDKKVVKPAQIALIDKSGAVIKPVFREDRKVGHQENTGLPLSVSPQAGTSGYGGTGVGINLNKIFGPHGSYSYTKVDWPKRIFTPDKRLQIVLPSGQSFLLPLTSRQMKTHTVLIFAAGIGLMFGPHALSQLAQSTPRPPGRGGSQSIPGGKSKQSKSTSTQNPSNKSAPAKNASTQHQGAKGRDHGHSHGGAGVGVGVNVDLGGIGQRRAEPDPFAVSAPPTAQTQERPEKPRTKKGEHEPSKTNPLAGVELTGVQAKGEMTSNAAAVDQAAKPSP